MGESTNIGKRVIVRGTNSGLFKPKECKFTVYVESIEILDAIEVLPCSDKAIKSIESVKEWAC